MKKFPHIVPKAEPPPPPPDTSVAMAIGEAAKMNGETHMQAMTELQKAIAASDARIVKAVQALGQAQWSEVRVKILRDGDGDLSELVLTREA